jgi:cysteine-rich repeat protein
MSFTAVFRASRVLPGLAALAFAGALGACGLDVSGELAGQSLSGSGSGSGASGASSTAAGSGGGEGGGSASSSGAGGAGGGAGGAGGMPAKCGDGILTAPEACDDSNTSDGDSCTADCGCGADNLEVVAFSRPADGHCYLFFKTPKAPLDALSDCNDLGADGATITTDGERTFVGGHLTETVWIGGTDFQFFGEQEWEWENDEPWLIKPCQTAIKGCDNTIDFWNPGEPNGQWIEDCLELNGNTDKFNDASCANSLPFLCEKSP